MQRCARLARIAPRARASSARLLAPRLRTNAPIVRRHYASGAEPYPPGSTGYRISTVFTTMIAVALAGTAYAVYEFYSSVTTYPQSIRPDLRKAIKAEKDKPLASARFYRKAWDAARELDASELSSAWPKKLSGLGIALAARLEGNGDFKEALQVMHTAWQDLEDSAKMDAEMRARRVAMASKMADLAGEVDDDTVEEEWAVWAVEEVLRGGIEQKKVSVKGKEKADDDELALPSWVGKAETVSVLEKLGSIYAKKGNAEYAVPLYLQALAQMPLRVSPQKTFFSTSPDQATPTSLCQAAVLFNNLSELFSQRAAPNTNELKQALQWGHRAMEALREASKMGLDNAEDPDACRRTGVVVQTNQATLLEMGGDLRSAEVLFTSAHRLADQVRWGEAYSQAASGLRRVQRAQGKQPSPPTPSPDAAK
ncbi:hypothetical protein CALVIDRAFT_538177 [Calocera viscosa TUFC12733]|uniref:Uncharacterized protein n=1 Tax=Calocera viscosa (strain TUFC12733) TaxID=1330018 RepID=A0A167L742_CALVF|nr:hypothetical protein CALVIDRAFT_538177 [Calocera viscosa TUFC12733]